MKKLFFVRCGVNEALRRIGNDPEVSKLSVTVRSSESMGFGEGCFVLVSGEDSAVKRCETVLSDVLNDMDGDTERKILKEIEKEGDDALRGFGRIFG